MEVLFSFGTSKQFPFQGGYIIINAADRQEAIQEFRKRYPDVHQGILNCSDVYTSPEKISDFKRDGNLGKGCHLYIPLNLPEFCYTVLRSTGEFAMLRRGESGYCPIKINLAGNPNIRDLADKLNQQFGITKPQEAAMVAGSMFGWDCPAANPHNYDKSGIPIKPNRKSKSEPYR